MSRNNHDGEFSARLSGYVADDEKRWWDTELKRVRKLEGLRNAGMGTLFGRIANSNLQLDAASLSKHPKSRKRVRDQDPARA